MRPDTEILEVFQSVPEPVYRAQLLKGFYNLPPQPNFLRFTVALNTHYFYITGGNFIRQIFSDGLEKTFTNPLSADSRLLSTGLAEVWSRKFAEDVNTGNSA